MGYVFLVKPPFSWAPNVPCPLVHHVSSNLIIPIAICFIMQHHIPISHANYAPPTSYPSHSNKPHATYYFPLLTPRPSSKCRAPTLHFLKLPWSCTCKTFSHVHFTTPLIAHDQTSQSTPISSTCSFDLHLHQKKCYPF